MTNSRKLLLAIGASVALSTSAFGDQLKLTSTAGVSNGNLGGSYTASNFTGPVNNSSYDASATISASSFETFCLEPTEFFTSGQVYAYTIASYALGGSQEAVGRNVGPGDQLSLGTTWLYSQFAQGILTGFDYGAGRQSTNRLLQRAFWYLEDELATHTTYSTVVDAMANPFLVAAASKFGGAFATAADKIEAARANAASGAYGVYALNLTSNNGQTPHQSQLYYSVPDEGATLALLGAALLSLMALRRKIAIAA